MILGGLVFLAGCKAPKSADNVVVPPQKFSESGHAPMLDKWWRSFGDENLNTLVEESLQGNFSLKTAADRLTQYKAQAIIAGADLYPQVQGEGNATRYRYEDRGGRYYESDYGLGVVASYEIDLWGRVRNTAEAAKLDVSASEDDLKTAAITLVASVSEAYFGLIESRGQLVLLDEQIKTNQDYLELVTLRFRRGQVSVTDVLQQKQLLESTIGDRKKMQATVKVYENQIAVLTGKSPGDYSVRTAGDLPILPALPVTPVPSELLQRRPDVHSTFLAVQAADKRVAVAIADCLPSFSLTISAGGYGTSTNELFSQWLGTLGGNMVAPLFEGGKLLAEVERRKAMASEAVNSYAHTMLTALREVEDALVQETQQEKFLESMKEQLKLSMQSVDQTRERYTKGAMDFLRFLTTVSNNQELQRTYLTSRRQLISYRISLYKALSGGWDVTPLEKQADMNIRLLN